MTTLSKQDREYETKDGTETTVQYTTTIPKRLVDAMDWEGGDELEWSVESGGKLGVTKVDE